MFARVRLLTREVQDALVVPEQAIVPQGDEWYVFRVIDGKAQRTKVEIGQRRDGKTEIIKGLEDNDVVVTAGQLKLREGVPVQVVGASAPTSSASAPPAVSVPPKVDASTPPATPKS
jgi:membrane fusion protein (multidrug efflux system)